MSHEEEGRRRDKGSKKARTSHPPQPYSATRCGALTSPAALPAGLWATWRARGRQAGGQAGRRAGRRYRGTSTRQVLLAVVVGS
jgi:hypothetical protein